MKATATASQHRIWLYITTLALAAAALVVATAAAGRERPTSSAVGLLALAGLVAVAEYFVVRLRMGRHIDAVNLVEAVMAPLLFLHTAPQVVAAVVAGQAVAAVARRNPPIKAAFNITQWALAAAAGAATFAALSGPDLGLTAQPIAALVLALLVVEAVNAIAFTLVMALATGARPPWIAPDVAVQAAANVAVGLLFAAAYFASPATVLTFIVPLALLHLAYSGQSDARADRARLAGLHRAGMALASQQDPKGAVPDFLHEVAATLNAPRVLLVLHDDTSDSVHDYRSACDDRPTHTRTTHHHSLQQAGVDPALAHVGEPLSIDADRPGAPHAAAVAAAFARTCLAAPLRTSDRRIGTLLVFDRAGVDGQTAAELAALEGIAREAATSIARAQTQAQIYNERQHLGRVINGTSDGIFALDATGTVQTWNPAMERLTGLTALEVVGRPNALDKLTLYSDNGRNVDLTRWATTATLPSELSLLSGGEHRRASCSYSRSRGPDGTPETLIVIARDLTARERLATLRAENGRLVEQHEAQRVVVEHLQQAVMPPLPTLEHTDLGVYYVAADESCPTGGDLYDSLALPNGDLHLAVVDVLGHGTEATQDALAVIHALRNVALGDVAFENVIEQAALLLGRSHEDLVATVVLARYNPTSGNVRVVSGGHPPALAIRSNGTVSELEPGGCAIGWPLAGSGPVTEFTLNDGDALLLYTDGLIEAEKDVVLGLERLAEAASRACDQNAQQLATTLVHSALSRASRRDDTLALVLRRAAAELPAPRPPSGEHADRALTSEVCTAA